MENEIQSYKYSNDECTEFIFSACFKVMATKWIIIEKTKLYHGLFKMNHSYDLFIHARKSTLSIFYLIEPWHIILHFLLKM